MFHYDLCIAIAGISMIHVHSRVQRARDLVRFDKITIRPHDNGTKYPLAVCFRRLASLINTARARDHTGESGAFDRQLAIESRRSSI